MSKVMPLFFALLLASCSTTSSSRRLADLPPKGPPITDGKILKNELPGGLQSLKGKKVNAFVVFNLPDGYLIRAKNQINPPDYAIKEVIELQDERISFLNEAFVVNCNECVDLRAEPPMQEISERDLLGLIDRASLGQEPTASDWKFLTAASKGSDYAWLILGTEDYEQKRGPVIDQGVFSAWSESSMHLRSYFFDLKKGKLVHSSEVNAKDFMVDVFPLPTELQNEKTQQAASKISNLEDQSVLEPQSSDYDSMQFDEEYPYPDLPQSPEIVRKAFIKLLETLNP